VEDSKAVELITNLRLPLLVDQLRIAGEITLPKSSQEFRFLASDLRLNDELAHTCAQVAALIMSAERELATALTLLKDKNND
tara:strand:- start:205 stop:450 length:246 start_codon:yes stop_codon:yes gene_type:complete